MKVAVCCFKKNYISHKNKQACYLRTALVKNHLAFRTATKQAFKQSVCCENANTKSPVFMKMKHMFTLFVNLSQGGHGTDSVSPCWDFLLLP